MAFEHDVYRLRKCPNEPQGEDVKKKFANAITGLTSPKRMKYQLCAAAIAAILAGGVHSAHASTLTIANFSFEAPGGFTFNAVPPSWTLVSSDSTGFYGEFVAFPTSFYSSAGTMDGPQAAYFRNTSNIKIGQVLTDTLQAGAQYGLTVAVGKRSTVAAGNYFIELLAGGVSLATATGTSLSSGTFSDVTINYTAPLVGALLGTALQIRIGEVGAGSDQAVDFDNVRLLETAAPVVTPLPAALPLFATGLGALSLLGWRRKRKVAAAHAAA